jgi:hypothetical protein
MKMSIKKVVVFAVALGMLSLAGKCEAARSNPLLPPRPVRDCSVRTVSFPLGYGGGGFEDADVDAWGYCNAVANGMAVVGVDYSVISIQPFTYSLTCSFEYQICLEDAAD